MGHLLCTQASIRVDCVESGSGRETPRVGSVWPAAVPDPGGSACSYQKAGLDLAGMVDAPVYANIDFEGEWPDVLHVTSCEIATNQRYIVQAIPQAADVGDEGAYSGTVILHTPSVWGDMVGTCFAGDCLPPQGGGSAVGVDDILAQISFFQGMSSTTVLHLDGHYDRQPACPSRISP